MFGRLHTGAPWRCFCVVLSCRQWLRAQGSCTLLVNFTASSLAFSFSLLIIDITSNYQICFILYKCKILLQKLKLPATFGKKCKWHYSWLNVMKVYSKLKTLLIVVPNSVITYKLKICLTFISLIFKTNLHLIFIFMGLLNYAIITF